MKAARKKPLARKGAAKKVAPKRDLAKKVAPKRDLAKKVAAKAPPPKAYAARADLGAPVDGFFARQPTPLRAVLEALRTIVEEAAPDATSALKWGMPVYTIGGVMTCALGAHKAHVNLILAGPPGTFDDPEDRLTGDGKTGRHLKLTTLDDLPRAAVRGWVRKAADVARAKA